MNVADGFALQEQRVPLIFNLLLGVEEKREEEKQQNEPLHNRRAGYLT